MRVLHTCATNQEDYPLSSTTDGNNSHLQLEDLPSITCIFRKDTRDTSNTNTFETKKTGSISGEGTNTRWPPLHASLHYRTNQFLFPRWAAGNIQYREYIKDIRERGCMRRGVRELKSMSKEILSHSATNVHKYRNLDKVTWLKWILIIFSLLFTYSHWWRHMFLKKRIGYYRVSSNDIKISY